VVAGLTDRVAVMYAGRIVEAGGTAGLLARPAHPYTAGLLASVPRLDRSRQAALTPISGTPPDLGAELHGCPFRPRCPRAIDQCVTDPPLEAVGPGQAVACWAPVNAPVAKAPA
jgi:oligopeptide/dipeptide ABC transporter ATP-binding protein